MIKKNETRNRHQYNAFGYIKPRYEWCAPSKKCQVLNSDLSIEPGNIRSMGVSAVSRARVNQVVSSLVMIVSLKRDPSNGVHQRFVTTGCLTISSLQGYCDFKTKLEQYAIVVQGSKALYGKQRKLNYAWHMETADDLVYSWRVLQKVFSKLIRINSLN